MHFTFQALGTLLPLVQIAPVGVKRGFGARHRGVRGLKLCLKLREGFR